MRIFYLGIVVVIIWAVVDFKELKFDIADFFYEDSPAPWENVDLHYYPDKNDRFTSKKIFGVGSLDGCRSVVHQLAADNDDSNLQVGDYECLVGLWKLTESGSPIYRLVLD